MKKTRKMNSLDPLKVSSYHYDLPQELIASSPSFPKGEQKLLVYERKSKKITHTKFKHIFDFIPKESAIVLNDTKVIKARIFGKKETGGKVELLLNSPLQNNTFLVYIKGKVKEKTKLSFEKNLYAIVLKLNHDGTRVVKFFQQNRELDFETLNTILEEIGHIPLPPYIKREDKKDDETNYQTLFAKNIGAVAAPTASLHFDDELFTKLKENFENYFITLHVGAGTFKSIEVEDIREHTMHQEWYNIPQNTKELIESKKHILAVGTTVTRTIEFYHREKKVTGYSNLFLHPKNPPQRVNSLLTNFHLPSSTLIMLVASFTSLEETIKIYSEAVKKRYKFYSYGESMLIV
jgi:S-adenosylmethionine:tRNA ribosyltransferase-isomerase